MTDLFPPTTAELIECVDRELKYRHRVYPRRVSEKKMTQAVADKQIALMTEVRNRLLLFAVIPELEGKNPVLWRKPLSRFQRLTCQNAAADLTYLGESVRQGGAP